jgi:glycolate oxidase FAD binding subunit
MTQPPDSFAPRAAGELAAALREASERDQPVVPWGAGSLQHLGNAPPTDALRLDTSALDQIVEYNPADLTITVAAGASLGAIQAALRPHGQWLPWDPAAPAIATIGGLLAAGASGPLRLGYGTPRDWVLGMRVALGDGRLVKSGGKVVKNVAGYETHKLHIGALGTLGVIVEVTLKVAPLPERIESVVFACPTRAVAFELAERLREPPLAPVSCVLTNGSAVNRAPRAASGGTGVGVRFAGVDAAVTRQINAAIAAANIMGGAIVDFTSEQSASFWHDLVSFSAPTFRLAPAHGGGDGGENLILRAGAAPSALSSVLALLEDHAPPTAPALIVGYAGVGLAYARWQLEGQRDGAALGASIGALRAGLAALGCYALIEDAPAELREQLDLWGEPPPTLALMRSLKAQWDPRGVLNRGRYLGRL